MHPLSKLEADVFYPSYSNVETLVFLYKFPFAVVICNLKTDYTERQKLDCLNSVSCSSLRLHEYP
jgi:hypothetical protein